jgi:glycine/D-amino acid oxidase-like deaminating enzyme
MLSTTPFWRDDFPRPNDLPVSDLPAAVDVAVVGSGVTGLNAAREIVRAGQSVAVLDSEEVGAGASTINGGMLNYGLKASTAKVFKRHGPALGSEFWDAALASIDHVADLVATENIDCCFERNGAAELGYRSQNLEEFREEAEWMRTTLGFETEVVPREALADVIDSVAFRCALVDSAGAGLHPARYVYGLARRVGEAGASIVEHAEALNIAKHTTGYQILTPQGKLSAGQVLLATNGYTGARPVPELRRRVVPIGSYIVVTEPLPAETVERLIPHNRMLWTSRRFLNYFRRTPDNRILMGGRNNLSTDLDLQRSAHILRATTIGIFPELEDVEFTHTWSGKLGITFDLMPHIGRLDGMWYALGYGGHGVGIGSYVGAQVGKLISGQIDRSPFAEIAHPTRPYYREKTWFLPAAAPWYRFLDTLGK